MKEKINQITSLHFYKRYLFILKNKTILFLVSRNLFLILHKKFNILNIAIGFHFLSKYIYNKAFFLELFQIFIHLELIRVLYRTKAYNSLVKALYIVKKEYFTISINELTLFLFFDNIAIFIKNKKVLYKLFKLYQSTIIILVYSNFFKKVFVFLYNTYKLIIKYNLSKKYLYKNIFFIPRKFPYLITFFCKNLYIKNLINELLYFLKIILKLITILHNYISIYINNDYSVNYIYGYYLILSFNNRFKLNIYIKKVMARFLCLGYSNKPVLKSNLNQYSLLNQIPILIKLKIFINTLIYYYKNSLNKRFVFIKIIWFLKKVFLYYPVVVNKKKGFSKRI